MFRVVIVIKGAGGGLHEKFSEIDFLIVSDRGNDIFQMLLVPCKNIVPSRSYRWSKVSAYV